MNALTKSQKAIFDYIKGEIESGGAPSIEEISIEFGYRSNNSAVQHVQALEKKGYLRRIPGKHRRIEILA